MMRVTRTYAILLLIVHKGCDGMTLVGVVTSLTVNLNGGMANAKMVGGAQDSAKRRRH